MKYRYDKLTHEERCGLGIALAILSLVAGLVLFEVAHRKGFKDKGLKKEPSEGLLEWLSYAKKHDLNVKKWKHCGRSNYLIGRHYQVLKSYSSQMKHQEATSVEIETLAREAVAKDLKFIDEIGFNRDERRVWLSFSKDLLG
ncbi:MAG: hypothetical protein FWF59_10880 [Turicibacter sp.]|nr:hypothetical protein [Turicibacter sp.]